MKDRVVELLRVRAGDLAENPKNWRKHPERQRAALRGLLDEIGYADALLARYDASGGLVLIDGALRKSLDADQIVPVLVLDVSEEEAEKLLATLDPISAMASADPSALLDLLSRVSTEDEGLRDLLEGLYRSAQVDLRALLRDPDAIPESAPPRSKRGDLFTLGTHRLLCGDATSKADMARLMSGEVADLYVTDPPYGISYLGKTAKRMRIQGDSLDGLQELLNQAFSRAAAVLREGAPLYCFHPAGAAYVVFGQAFLAQGWSLRQTLIWAKHRPILGHSDWAYQHEGILYGFTPSAKRRGRGSGGWYGGNSQSSLIEVPSPAASREHPTAKPVELLRRLISNSSRRGQIVLDSFGGSGSALVAAEQLERRAYLMEIDPAYADVIVSRYESLTGEVAHLEEDTA